MGGLLAGTILLATATSLPELTITVSAGLIGNADIAVGNGLGSILFNIFILFVLDIYFRSQRLFLRVKHDHIYTGMIALILCILTVIGLSVHVSVSLFTMSLTSIAIVVTYIAGMRFVSKKQQENIEPSSDSENPTKQSEKKISVQRAVIGFFLFSILIFFFGSVLSISGDVMADTTGISATTVGSIFASLATSIPDAMSVFMSLKLANVNMAIGTILGSNVFNLLVIAIADLVYVNGSIWLDTSDELMYVSLVGIILTIMVMVIIKRDHTRNRFTYLFPSIIAVTSYVAVVSFLFLG
ncbi:cation:H+ antiporter [Alteribacillus iranensis]|uniref:Cation:H+ antiporter n=2 Tax=Alteribacillus iranensis TaxID=930128 RepID=A0A1I2BTN9_9BACI|nr:cation:H+ antiporter [Alteribacillus iranensis]